MFVLLGVHIAPGGAVMPPLVDFHVLPEVCKSCQGIPAAAGGVAVRPWLILEDSHGSFNSCPGIPLAPGEVVMSPDNARCWCRFLLLPMYSYSSR